MTHEPWVDEVLVFLVAAGIVVPLFHWARVGAVLGFLIAGIIVGPFGLGRFAEAVPVLGYLTIEDPEGARPLAELGVIFLLFLLGLELSLSRLWTLRRYVLGVGGLQVAASAVGIGLAAYLFGLGSNVAVVLGLCLALSSTAVVMQLLVEQRRVGSPVGRVSLSVLLFQDIMVVPILFVTQILGDVPDGGSLGIALALGKAMLQAAVAVAVILGAGRFVLRPLFRFAARTRSRDLILGITLLSIFATAVGTELAGLSSALGAFLAGLLLSESEYRHQIEVDLEPFKGLLLGLFFMTVGMSINIELLIDQALLLVAGVAALLIGKAAILYLSARLMGVPRSVAGETALLMSQSGEFAFIVLGIALVGGVVEGPLVQTVTAMVGITMLLTPVIAWLARSVGRRLEALDSAHDAPSAAGTTESGHVVIGGFGRVGETVARVLEAENVSFVALDANPVRVAEQRKLGRQVFFGDASRIEILDRAGVEEASAFIVTLDQPGLAERMVQAIATRRPDAVIVARASDAEHAKRLIRAGATGVVPETVESSLQLVGRLLEGLGYPEDAANRRLTMQREDELARLASMVE
ncbi:MAG: cation:proton antiporter [Pseudomonadota bacterium]